VSGARREGLEQLLSRLDRARQGSETAAAAYRRARRAAERGKAAGLGVFRAELVARRTALAGELERVGGLACPTPEAAAPLALAFREACATLVRTDLLESHRAGRRRPPAVLR
jgi:hypothetical protein